MSFRPRFAPRSGLTTHLALACVLLLVAPCAAAREIAIGFVGPPDGDAWHGARQGIAEANAQGRFLGLSYVLAAIDDDASGADGAVAVVVDVPAARVAALADALAGVAVINVGAAADALRRDCRANLLHTLPSEAMRADAVRQWRQLHPAAEVGAQAWHPAFEKYAAAQLNRRYEEAAGHAMSDVAWAAWAAVKAVSDQLALQPEADAAAVLEALRGPLAFDGQKGDDLSFRQSGQLRQPLLIVQDGELVGEAPVRGVATDLDSLGADGCAAEQP